jgi:integrase
MSYRTADKYITMLRPMWDWAVSDRRLTSSKYKSNPWEIIRSVPRSKRSDRPTREAFTPSEMAQLLNATKRGTRGGDALRLALASGVRINELVLLNLADVDEDGGGFVVKEGKTESATRYIPLVGDARDILRDRMEALGDRSGRLFPEWPIKPSTGSCGAVTRWFIDLRRKVLGDASEGRLALHSTRHTWRTVARRAGVPDEDVKQLGGWAGDRSASSVYDHGLTEPQLRERQEKVWAELQRAGYLSGF